MTAGGLSAVLPLAGCGSGTAPAPPAAAATPHAWHGPEPEPVPDRPTFVLTDNEGRSYDFAEQTGGRPTLVYFGYTNCPDECPTAMADIAAALRTTPGAVREQVKVVLVTTDPDRGTAPVLRRWLDQFDPAFIGLRAHPPRSTLRRSPPASSPPSAGSGPDAARPAERARRQARHRAAHPHRAARLRRRPRRRDLRLQRRRPAPRRLPQ